MMSDRIIVIRQDPYRRPPRVDVYEEGEPVPDDVAHTLRVHGLDRERQVFDQREETKTATRIGNKFSSHFRLPTGEIVNGKKAVLDAGYELP